jgi:hypothetical protein
MSLSMIWCQSLGSTGVTDSKSKADVPRITLHDSGNATYMQSSDNRLWYGNGETYPPIKNCHVSLDNNFIDSSTDLMCSMSRCYANIVLNGTCNLTGRQLCTKTFENLTCYLGYCVCMLQEFKSAISQILRSL